MDNDKKTEVKPEKKTFSVKQLKEAAAVLVCAVTVFAFLSIGFVIMLIKILFGLDVVPPGEWLAAMLSLASTAIGFLAGAQQSRNNSEEPAPRARVERMCDKCD